MMIATINVTMSMGDAGWPLDVEISVDYDEVNGEILVSAWEDDSTFDNPPLNWGARINEKIEDNFHPKEVIFL